MTAIPRPVLVAEDEESDALLLRRVFSKVAPNVPLTIVRDGKEVVDYLSGSGSYANCDLLPLPALLVLDLKMPRMNGFEVLDWLKTRPELRTLPAVILTSSSFEHDKVKALQLGAREYLIKAQDLSQFSDLLHDLLARWNLLFSHESK
jgi:CheY-like chemotaxis protein